MKVGCHLVAQSIAGFTEDGHAVVQRVTFQTLCFGFGAFFEQQIYNRQLKQTFARRACDVRTPGQRCAFETSNEFGGDGRSR